MQWREKLNMILPPVQFTRVYPLLFISGVQIKPHSLAFFLATLYIHILQLNSHACQMLLNKLTKYYVLMISGERYTTFVKVKISLSFK